MPAQGHNNVTKPKVETNKTIFSSKFSVYALQNPLYNFALLSSKKILYSMSYSSATFNLCYFSVTIFDNT